VWVRGSLFYQHRVLRQTISVSERFCVFRAMMFKLVIVVHT
jgi:hypothetical protein